MESLEISGFKHNPDIIKSYFKIVNNKTFVNEYVRVLFPKRFIDKGLAVLSAIESKVLGIYAIVDNYNNYAKVLSPIYQNLSPINIEYMTIDGVEYVGLVFEPDNTFIINNTLSMSNRYLYDIFNEFFLQGRIPWYMSYEDVCYILSESQKFCDSNIGDNTFIYEVLTSNIAKDPKNKKIRFRNSNASKPIYIGMNDIRYGYNNTGSRLTGGYLQEAIVASIVDPETTPSESMKVLRY